MSESETSSKTNKPQRTLPEWITLSVSLSILFGLIGLVIYDWFLTREEPAILEVYSRGKVREINQKFYVPFEVQNQGGSTAEAVQVIAELKIADNVEESGEQQIDFLSGGEQEAGEFIFKNNPKTGQLIIRVASYKTP